MTIQTACSRLDRCQCADQGGFRRNFWTTDHLMTYRMIEQKSREWGRPTYGLQPSSSRRLLLHYNMKQSGGVWLVCKPLFWRRHNVDGHVHHAHGGAARRRERRLRAFLRHEQPSLAKQTVTVSHHSWRRAGRADASTQTVSYSAPAPVVEHAAPAPVFEYAALAPVHSDFLEPPVPIVQVAKVPQVQFIEKSTRFSKSSLLKTPKLPKAWEPLPFAV